MIKCKNCDELIGDNVSECPFCKTVFSQEDIKKALLENERIHLVAEENTIKEYAKRIKAEIIVSAVAFMIAMLGMIVIATLNLEYIWGLALFFFIAILYILCVLKLHIGLCPYCESFMGRGMFFRTHCPRCGGKLR